MTMAWTIDDAISDKTLCDAKVHVREVSFRLGSLTPRIRVRLFRRPGDKEIYWEQSHFLQIQGQESERVTTPRSDSDEAYALTHAAESLTRAYQAAVEQGYEPADAWLVPNSEF